MLIPFEEIFQQALQYQRSSVAHTKQFRRLKHNNDLCPQFERQLGVIMDCFLKHGNAAYDVQGIHDRGSDVIFRYGREEQQLRFIALQIKSFDDLKASSYLKDLKAQRYEAAQDFRDSLSHYFIVLCTDNKTDRNKVREIKKAFAADEGVTVIDPEYAMSFYRMTVQRIVALVENVLRHDDTVLTEARKSIAEFTPPRAVVALTLLEHYLFESAKELTVYELQEKQVINGLYKSLPDLETSDYFEDFEDEEDFDYDDDEDEDEDDERNEDEEPLEEDEDESLNLAFAFRRERDQERDLVVRLSEDVDGLSGAGVSVGAGGEIQIAPEQFHAVSAVMLDASVRYDYGGATLVEHCFEALRVADNFPVLMGLADSEVEA